MPNDDDSSRFSFDSVLDFAWEKLADVVRDVAPQCCQCGDIAIPIPCSCCGHFSCKDHGFFNLGMRRSICLCCVAELPQTDRAQPARRRRKGKKAPWDLLGLSPSATEEEIQKAFRQMALTCHPDLHPGDEDAASRFRGLQRAVELCLREARSR